MRTMTKGQKEHKKEYNKKWYQDHKEHSKECAKRWHQAHKELKRECGKKWRQKHKEELKESKKKWYQDHKEEQKENKKKYYQDHKEERKEYDKRRHYKKMYNLTLEEIDQILIKQNHKCALCGMSLLETKRCTDHSHKTNKVRGILCDRCNKGLGFFQYFYDNPEFFKKTIKYIKE